MKTLSPDDFWRLLHASNVLEEAKLDSLRRRVEQKESIGKSSTKIARVLVANEILTASQARRLLSGKKLKSSPAGPPPQEAPKPAPRNRDSQTSEASAKPTASKKKYRLPLILAGTTLLFSATAFGLWRLSQPTSPISDTGTSTSQVRTEPTTQPTTEGTSDEEQYEFVESETALWGREVPGKPIALSYAPAGVQTAIHIRMAELLRHDEGPKILRSLGPQLQAKWQSWLARMKVSQADLAEVALYLTPQGTTLPQVVVVASLQENKPVDSVLGFGTKDNQSIGKLATDAVWFPNEESSLATFVFGPEKLVRSIAADHRDANPVMLRRELEQLRKATHDTDHVTILTNPNFLRDEAQDLFPEMRRSLLDGLYEFWSQEAQAVSLGMQLNDVALVEVRMIAREDLPPRRLAGRVQKFVAALPDRTTGHLGRVQLDPYWQPLAMRFPTMLHFLREQARVADEGKQVAANVALPVEGIHNLLLATELSSATPVTDVATNVVDRSSWKMDEVLQSKTSIRFSQKSLEQAMNDIAVQVREELKGLPFTFSIELVGADLELDGITRNQQIRDFSAANVSVSDALTAIVQKANPVQGVTDAASPDQKLVWAVGSGKVLITTKSAAKQKGIDLPAVFGE